MTYAAAQSVAGEVILSQGNSQYAAGNHIFDTSYDRLPAAPNSGTSASTASIEAAVTSGKDDSRAL
ncbi:MAG: hypothetical protein ACLPY1_01360 [Terracidiphilus sp.]